MTPDERRQLARVMVDRVSESHGLAGLLEFQGIIAKALADAQGRTFEEVMQDVKFWAVLPDDWDHPPTLSDLEEL